MQGSSFLSLRLPPSCSLQSHQPSAARLRLCSRVLVLRRRRKVVVAASHGSDRHRTVRWEGGVTPCTGGTWCEGGAQEKPPESWRWVRKLNSYSQSARVVAAWFSLSSRSSVGGLKLGLKSNLRSPQSHWTPDERLQMCGSNAAWFPTGGMLLHSFTTLYLEADLSARCTEARLKVIAAQRSLKPC